MATSRGITKEEGKELAEGELIRGSILKNCASEETHGKSKRGTEGGRERGSERLEETGRNNDDDNIKDKVRRKK